MRRLHKLLSTIDKTASGAMYSEQDYSLGEAIILLTGGVVAAIIGIMMDFFDKPRIKRPEKN